MKHRLARVNELIKRELSEVIGREMNFGNILVTISQVDVTPDLKNAHVFVSAIGGAGENVNVNVIGRLEEKRNTLQHELSRRVILKYTPHLHFKLDTSIERGTRVFQVLEELGLPEEKENEE